MSRWKVNRLPPKRAEYKGWDQAYSDTLGRPLWNEVCTCPNDGDQILVSLEVHCKTTLREPFA